MNQTPISLGSRVTFETDSGPQDGTVCTLTTDISNGCRVASVCVPGALNDAPWSIPVSQLCLVS